MRTWLLAYQASVNNCVCRNFAPKTGGELCASALQTPPETLIAANAVFTFSSCGGRRTRDLHRSTDAFPGAQFRDLNLRQASFRQHLVGMRAKLR